MATAGVRGRCIFCRGALPSNEVVERFPVGRRIAFDPRRGRLWAVCPSCRRWNLAPFEERWEALEELEKARVDHGRVLASTEHISLIRVPGVELVRVGEARLAEEAWWRYGTQMMRRRTRARILGWTEQAALVGLSVATGGVFYLFMGGDGINNLLRWRQFGSRAWQGERFCTRCASPLTALSFREARKLELLPRSDGDGDDYDPVLRLRCWRCRLLRRDGGYVFEGAAARHVLRRVVTHGHYKGASAQRVRSATDYIEARGAPEAVIREATASRLRLDTLLDRHRRTEAVALEIALNEGHERRLLEMEVSELEARWREEEEVAAIADGLLTPVPALARARSAVDSTRR